MINKIIQRRREEDREEYCSPANTYKPFFKCERLERRSWLDELLSDSADCRPDSDEDHAGWINEELRGL